MRTITIYLLSIAALFMAKTLVAQEDYQKKIEILKEQKTAITEQEKEALKFEVTEINKRVDDGLITVEEAQTLKEAAAQKRALNIENRIAIVENKILLINRNNGIALELTENSYFEDNPKSIFGIDIKHIKEPSFEKRTYSDLVIAFGLNNAARYGESLSESPYKYLDSKFFEIGYAWNTRLSKNSNWLRLKYGFSFQFNGLKPTDNKYFEQIFDENGVARVELVRLPGVDGEPYFALYKSKLRMDNLVFPFHFEFGPSLKRQNGSYVRYSTHKKFKIGVGGYLGFNYKNIQKVKLEKNSSISTYLSSGDGGNQKTIYGVSGYLGWDDISLYFKYDLTQIFPGPSLKQNNMSLGLRFDL